MNPATTLPIVEAPHIHGPELYLNPVTPPTPTAPTIPNQVLPYDQIHPICVFTSFKPTLEIFEHALLRWFTKLGNHRLLIYNEHDFFNLTLPEVIDNFLERNRKFILHNTDQPFYPIIFFNLRGKEQQNLREWLHTQNTDHFKDIHCILIANSLAAKWVKRIISKFHIKYSIKKKYLHELDFDHLKNEFKALEHLRIPYGFWHKLGKVLTYPFRVWVPFRKCIHDSELEIKQGPNYSSTDSSTPGLSGSTTPQRTQSPEATEDTPHTDPARAPQNITETLQKTPNKEVPKKNLKTHPKPQLHPEVPESPKETNTPPPSDNNIHGTVEYCI
jgi:hypothetical protein